MLKSNNFETSILYRIGLFIGGIIQGLIPIKNIVMIYTYIKYTDTLIDQVNLIIKDEEILKEKLTEID